MSDLFDRLQDQLRAAAERQTGAQSAEPVAPAGGGRGRRGWLRRGLGATPAIIAVATTVIVAVVALLALGHSHPRAPRSVAAQPPQTAANAIPQIIGSPRMRQEMLLIMRATAGVRNTRACQVPPFNGPTLIQSPAPAADRAQLGVLSRSATPADRLPDTGILAGGGHFYLGSIRRARVVDGVSYYIVVGRENPASMMPPAACFGLQRQALQQALPSIAPSLRRSTVALQAQLIAQARQMAAATADTLCFIDYTRNSSDSSCGIGFGAIRSGLAGPQSQNQRTLSGIVPDGVATVTLRFAASARHAPFSASGDVVANVYVIQVGPHALPANAPVRPSTIVWRSASGRVIKTITPPSLAAVTRMCRRSIATCIAMSSVQTGGSSSGSSSSGSSSSSSTSAQGSGTANAPPSSGGPVPDPYTHGGGSGGSVTSSSGSATGTATATGPMSSP